MKKILLLTLPLLLTACIGKQADLEIEPTTTVKDEIVQPETIPSNKPAAKPTPTRPAGKKPEVTTNTKPDPKTDDMTRELDSLIDELIGG